MTNNPRIPHRPSLFAGTRKFQVDTIFKTTFLKIRNFFLEVYIEEIPKQNKTLFLLMFDSTSFQLSVYKFSGFKR